MTRGATALLSISLLFSACGNAQTKPLAALSSAPSSAELHKLFDDENYAQFLKELPIAMSAKDQSAYDRYDLLTLKGEALLKTKADAAAADAFRDAAKAAKSDDAASLARATELLVRRSRQELYTPAPHDRSQTASTAAIDIIEKESRKSAFAALYADEQAA